MIHSSNESKEHIAVAISGTRTDYESGKLFGVGKLKSSAGANQAPMRDEGLVYLG